MTIDEEWNSRIRGLPRCAVLVRLAELGHVVVTGDAASLSPTGWHVGG